MREEEAQIFLLSPANLGGPRAQPLLTRPWAGPRTIGEVYTYISSLYFRGKIIYSQRFSRPPGDGPGALVIVPGFGLVPPDWLLDADRLQQAAGIPVDALEPQFTTPLVSDMEALVSRCAAACRFVLLGSVASGKYVEPLLPVLGERLVFPAAFVGRGDMSRGGLMLRAAESGKELEYIPVAGAERRGKRPPKLPKKPRI